MKFKFLNKGEIEKLPKTSGVYILLGKKKYSRRYCFKNKEILYIGKAVNIRERVKNHFQQPGFKESIFLYKTEKIGFIKTNSEIEALILEANLIKKYQPKFNVMWRDDKNYFFVGITNGDFPQVFITHQIKNKNNYIGPFVDGKALKQTLKILRKIFPYRSCKHLPRKPCLWYQLDRCLAPCILISGAGSQIPSAQTKIKREMKANVRSIFEILKGRENEVLRKLKKEMKAVSRNQDFEKASSLRDKIFALEKAISHSRIPIFEEINLEKKDAIIKWAETQKNLQKLFKTRGSFSRIEAFDISNIQGLEATGSMVSFFKGKPDKNSYRKFKIKNQGKPNDVAMIKEVIGRRLNHKEWPYPDLMLVDGGISQFNAAKSVIKNKKILIAAISKTENKLFIKKGRMILLKTLPRKIFNLILQLRDEAHRFAIAYHKKLRQIKTFN
jgi:excinuclease ABC subunit C